MFENDSIEYKEIKIPKFYVNKNLHFIIQCIAFKYNITTKISKFEMPKMKQTKKFIIDKCYVYFNVKVSQKQISFLLRPQKGKFPYTAIVILETVYNLLKDNNGDNRWKEKMIYYLSSRLQGDKNYEIYSLNKICIMLASHVDEIMESSYKTLYKCMIDSKDKFYEKFIDITMNEHLEQDFPSDYFKKQDIPKSIFSYQESNIYFKVK